MHAPDELLFDLGEAGYFHMILLIMLLTLNLVSMSIEEPARERPAKPRLPARFQHRIEPIIRYFKPFSGIRRK
jgi:hypothetical protein